MSKVIKKTKEEPETSEEDRKLQEELLTLVDVLTQNANPKVVETSLDSLRMLIRTSTTSMTSVPKPLKYLCSHYPSLKSIYSKVKADIVRKKFADVLSVLALTHVGKPEEAEKRECLNFCLAGTMEDVGNWGHEYVRQLEMEITEEWISFPNKVNKLLPLVENIVRFDTAHHADIQACDMLMEIDRLDMLQQYLDSGNYARVCIYLISCANYVEDNDSKKIHNLVIKCYMRFNEFPRALIAAIRMGDESIIKRIFHECPDPTMRKQLAYILGRQQISIDLDVPEAEKEDLSKILSNCFVSDLFHSLGRELDIMEPKTPDDVFKAWLEPTVHRGSLFNDAGLDSAKQNLSASFVNAFVNASFGVDKLVSGDDGNRWIHRNKEHGMLSACASLGLIHLWDVYGIDSIDKYLYTSEDFVKSGALLALGIVNCGVHNEFDAALALLSDYIMHDSQTLRMGSILGLGMAYAGTNRQDVLDIIYPVISCPKSTHEVLGLVYIACGMIAVGSCSVPTSTILLQQLIENQDKEFMNSTFCRYLFLGLGLLYLGKKNCIEVTMEALEVLSDPHKSMAQTTLTMCGYAGTGDVLVVQELLHICCDSYTKYEEKTEKSAKNLRPSATNSLTVIFNKDKNENLDSENTSRQPLDPIQRKPIMKPKPGLKNDDTNQRKRDDRNVSFIDPMDVKEKKKCAFDMSDVQSIAVLAVACTAMGEETGSEMSHRIFGHLARYGELGVKKAVPLAVALCSISNPQLSVIDLLNKYSHDSDTEVAYNAIFSMGLVGAGTNNARLAAMLRQQASFHSRHPVHLFMVRLAQGLTCMGKGTMSLSPFHSDRQIMNPTAVAGLLVTLVSMLDCKNIILAKSHYLMYTLAAAMHIRWLVTVDENMNQISVTVRVGQAVDVVGKAGIPKTIAGSRTHTTPVLLAVGERAELATDEYISLTPVLEGFVILRKNN